MIGIIIALVCFAVILLLNVIKTGKLSRRLEKLIEKHNGLCDTTADSQIGLIEEFNDRIDEINREFGNVYASISENDECMNDIINTLELMCDTDEMLINRADDMEEDLTINNVILDDILSELFSEQPEEVEEKPAKKAKKSNKK